MVISPLQLKYDTARDFREQLISWEIPVTGCFNAKYHYAFEFNRFHCWCYWRPLTVARYEQLTIDYHGPHLPVFVSRTEYINDEQYVYEGFDFNMAMNHRYRYVKWYAVVPSFLLYRPWPSERNWRWCPAVRISSSILKSILETERDYGGWRLNCRGRLMIPKKTGCSGKREQLLPREGWASLCFNASERLSEKEQELLFL